LDTQVGVIVPNVRFGGDDTLDDDGLGLIVVRGERSLIKMRLGKIESECTKNRGKCEDENPAWLGGTPRENDTNNVFITVKMPTAEIRSS
jgi:hypothetical protein